MYIYIDIHHHNILRARPSCKTQHAKRLSSHSSCAASAGRKKASNATPATRTVMTVMLSPGFLNLTLQTLIPTKWLQCGSVDIKRLESSPWPEMVRKQLRQKKSTIDRSQNRNIHAKGSVVPTLLLCLYKYFQ